MNTSLIIALGLLALGILIALNIIHKMFIVVYCKHDKHHVEKLPLVIRNSKGIIIGSFTEYRCKKCGTTLEFKANRLDK